MASAPCLRSLARIAGCSTTAVRGNAHRASLGAAARHQYLRKYQLNLVRPDGSMVNVRASEPLNFFAMPIDLKQLSEDERLQLLAARKPKAKIIVKESIDDNFDASAYMSSDFWSVPSTATPTTSAASTDAAPKEAAAAEKTKSADGKKSGKKVKTKKTEEEKGQEGEAD